MSKQTIFFLVVLAAFFLSMPVQAFAQDFDDSPEDLLFMDIPMVTSVGFFDTEARKAPGSLYTVNALQLEASNARTIAEVLGQYAPGVYITNHGFMGPLIGSRGVTIDNSSKTTFMIDGMSTNPRWHFGASEAARMPFLGDIDRLELIQGPGAIVHGAGAINGFINMIPKNGTDHKGWTFSTKYGFDEHLRQTESGYGMSYGKDKDLYLFMGLAKSSGVTLEQDMGDTGASWADATMAGKEPYFKVNRVLYPALKMASYWRHDKFKLNAVFERNFSTPYEIWWIGQGTYHGMLALNPQYIWDISPTETLTSDTSLILQDNQQIYLQDGWQSAGSQSDGTFMTGEKGDILIDLDNANGSSESYLGQKFVYKTEKIDRHQIAAGCEIGKRDFFGNGFAFFWNDFTSTGQQSPQHIYGWLEYSFFIEDVISLTDQLTLSLGGREDVVDYPDTFVSHYNNVRAEIKNGSIDHFSPRVALAYEVSPRTIVKTSYQHGFRWPNAADVLRNMSPRLQTSDGLYYVFAAPGPETMDSYEFNVHHDVKELKLGLDLNMYYNKLYRTLGWAQPNGDNALGAEYNSPSFDSIGYELAGKWQAFAHTSIDASYSYSRPWRYKDDIIEGPFAGIVPTNRKGNAWARYPDQMLKLSVTSKFMNDKLTLHENIQLRSGWKYNENASDYETHYKWLDQPSVVFNAAVKYDFTKNWYTKFSVNNLFRDRNTMPIWGESTQFFAQRYSDRRQMYLEMGCKF